MDKKKFLQLTYGKENISQEEINKIQADTMDIKVSASGSILGYSEDKYLDPRYNKLSNYISGSTPNPEKIADDLQGTKEILLKI